MWFVFNLINTLRFGNLQITLFLRASLNWQDITFYILRSELKSELFTLKDAILLNHAILKSKKKHLNFLHGVYKLRM